MPVFALAPAAATAFWGAVGGGALATGQIVGAHKSAKAATEAAQIQSDTAAKAAEIQAQSARESLDFTKQQDAADRAAADKAARLNYGQWAEQQGRISSLGEMLGLAPRRIGPYDSVVNPSSSASTGGAPSGGGGGTGKGNTMPGAGEVDWTAAPDVLGKQLTDYYTKRGVAASEVPYWVSHAGELVARGKQLGDPNYANMRLSLSEVFGGPTYGSSGASSAKKSPAPTTTGLGAYLTTTRPKQNYVITPRLGA